MSDVWSPLVDHVYRSARLDRATAPKGRPLPVRRGNVQAAIVHTTGSGAVVKALKKGIDPFEYLARYYAKAHAYASGYLVGERPGVGIEVVGTVPDDRVAYHAGVAASRAAIYRRGRDVWPRFLKRSGQWFDTGKTQPHYRDWLERWPDLDCPLDLLDGFSLGVNARTLSADLLAPEPGERHRQAQIDMMVSLVEDLLSRHALQPSRLTVLRHADVDPLSRSSRRGGWDPPRRAFESLLSCLGLKW